MFKAKRRFVDTRAWVKVEGESLDGQFKNMSSDYDVYILRHWFYCMATAPIIMSFNGKEFVSGYLKTSVSAGDRVEIYGIMVDNLTSIVSAKIPDEEGLVPLKGAY